MQKNQKGKHVAPRGKHDDEVISTALVCIGAKPQYQIQKKAKAKKIYLHPMSIDYIDKKIFSKYNKKTKRSAYGK